MIYLPGYTINKQIYESSNSIIYRGVNDKEGTPVVVKILNGEFPSSEQLARFRREYEMTRKYTGSRIINAYTLETYRNSLAIILEDFGGDSLAIHLSEKKRGIKESLSLAIKMTEALEQVHLNHIIHKDINPSNFVWNPETDQLKIIDFGISSELSRETTEIDNPDILEGTLSYISPEQTGRMNKSIDYRTDFYSLGITFYEMLTGQLPFYHEDSMEMVYSHIAKIPTTPSKLNPDVPPAVSEIIMKLLSKSAEDRFQSTSGLKQDLIYCLQQTEMNGSVETFQIAKNDISDRFQIPQKLYGRDNESRQLINTFKRAAEKGTSEILMVCGHSGIGKTSLINEVQKTIVEKRGYFISGKFDQLKRDIPYSSLIQAFQGLIQQLLSQQEEKVTSIREKLLNALGQNGQVIIDVIPEVELIIGKQPKLTELPPEQSRIRFEYTFQHFIGCLSAPGHPLILFLDDLQWADASSLQLINVIMNKTDIRHLLIIGAFRDNEVHKGHLLLLTLAEIEKTIKVNTIRLSRLELSHVNQLISETLVVNPEKTMAFSDLCFNKTQGNPFFLNQFLHMLYRSGAIFFNPDKRCWQWDITKVKHMEVTDNVVDLMISKIQGLPPKTQGLLSLAACIGTRFDLKILSVVYKKTLADTANDLWGGLKEEIVQPVDKSYKYIGLDDGRNESDKLLMIPTYRFVHDRIQQAAYQMIGENEKLFIHWEIGNLMLENFSEEEKNERLFDVVEHLNTGRHHAATLQEKDPLAALNLKAGLKARKSAAYEISFYYFKVGISLLGEKAWKRSKSLTLKMYTQAAEAAYLSGNYEKTKYFSEIVLANTNQLLEQVNIYDIRILSDIAQNRLKEANELGIKVLKLLGIRFHPNPGVRQMVFSHFKLRWNLRGKSIEHFASLPLMTDSHMLATVRIISRIQTSSLFINPFLAGIAVYKQMDICLKYGNSPFSAYVYASYGIMLCAFRNFATGYRFGQLALQLAELPQFKHEKPRTVSIVNIFITHWKNHQKDSLPEFFNAYQLGIDNGDPEFASYSLFWHCFFKQALGKDLNLLLNRDLKQYLHIVKKLKVDTGNYGMEIHTQFVFNLTNRTADPCCLSGKYYDEKQMVPIHEKVNDGFVIHFLYLCKLILCYLFEDMNLALESGKKCKKYLRSGTGTITEPLVNFYHALTNLALYPQMDRSTQKFFLKKIARSQKYLKHCANHSPMNYLHKYQLVEAELANVLNQTGKAVVHYEQAIKGAKENEFIQEEALANELFAKFWLKRNNTDSAQLYMQKAHNLYHSWGAAIKADDLEKRYSHLLKKESESVISQLNPQALLASDPTIRTTSKILDIDSLMKANQAISGEITLNVIIKKLMHIVMRNAGAQKGLLILKEGDRFIIVGKASSEKTEDIIYESRSIEKSDDLSQSIVNYSIRTRNTVVLGDAMNTGAFTQDAYIRKNRLKSILCAPIIRQTELTGLLYLENNQTTDVFTPERLKVIQILISQSAISFENAKLYNNLSQSEEKYRNILKNIEEGYFETDMEGKYTYVNDFFVEMFGYTKKELLQLNYRALGDKKSSKDIFIIAKSVLETGKEAKNKGGEGTAIRKDGSTFLCEFQSASLIKDNEGKPIGFRGIVRDISDRKKKELAETKQKIAEATTKAKSEFLTHVDGYYEIDLKGNFTFTNQSLNKMFGYSNDRLIGINYKTYMDDKNAKKVFKAFNEVFRTEKNLKAIEWEGYRKDGSFLVSELSISLIKDAEGKPIGFRGINRDITEKKEAEKLRTEKEVAVKADKAKSEFVANMSHEIRTPMNAIIGFSNLGLEENKPDKHNDYFKKIQSSAVSLLGIINDVLDFSKMEAGKLTLDNKNFRLDQVLKDLSDMFASIIEEKELEMSVSIGKDVPCALFGDRLRLRQVLINLIGNAIKFTNKGHVIITVKNLTKTGHDTQNETLLKFLVQDSGVGLTDRQVGRLFKSFSQGDSSTTRKYGGTGLGLVISKQLAEMMAGNIWVDSQYGKGSTFSFTAKFQIQSGDQSELSDDIHGYPVDIHEGLEKIRGANILLVEDDQSNQEVATGLLEGKDLHVTVAENGEAAIACVCDNGGFDAVLMDIQMPDIDGYEATRTIRNDGRFKTLPIIAMTAHVLEDEKKKCLDAGMNDHVSKPIDPVSLFTALIKWIPPREQQAGKPGRRALVKTDDNDTNFELPAHLPGVNLNAGLDKIGGQKNLYIKMLKTFKRNYAGFSDTLSTAYHNNNIDTVKQMIHKINSASGNIGADALHTIAKDLDSCLKNSLPDGLDSKLAMFHKALKTVLDSIDHLTQSDISEDTANQTNAPDIDNLLAELIKIDELLSELSPESEYLFDTVKDDLISLGFKEQTQELAESIEELEYQNARDMLVLLKDKIMSQKAG